MKSLKNPDGLILKKDEKIGATTMRNKITFFVLSTTGTPIRQASASKNLLLFMSFLAIAVVSASVVGLFYGIQDYRECKIASEKNAELVKDKEEVGITVAYQKNQIRQLANEIDTLKSDLGELRDFEKRIRIFANIEGNSDEGLFGVGGSLPEDLDPSEKIKEGHNSLIREMHDQVGVLNQAAVFQKNGFETLLEGLEEQRNILACTPSIHPTSKGYITSAFGYRKSPFTGFREFHKGLDISSRRGTPIYATADGVATFVGKKGLLGKVIIIDHGHGMLTRYGHCSKYTVKVGQKVKRGDVIGKVGNTGRSTGPHVHYEVHLNGIPVNPEYYILN